MKYINTGLKIRRISKDSMNIIIALFVFGFIVLIHELGHFIFAKRAGIKVVEFSIGMGPRLFKINGKETIYSIKLLPLGGSCMMLGEDEEEERLEGSFNSKGVLDRFLVIFAGPLFNFILAFFISILIIANIGVDKPVIAEALEGYPAVEAGMQKGDEIIKLDNKNITIYREIPLYIYMNPGKAVNVKVKRNTETGTQVLDFLLEPKYSAERQGYLIGIRPEKRSMLKNPLSILGYSLNEVKYNINMAVEGILYMIAGKIKPSQVSGPVGIVKAIGDTVEESKPEGIKVILLNLGVFMALLSANLGVMNLLPIPALDGGRILFILIEAVTRRPINRKAEGYIHFAGFALLMLLMVFILFNDIKHLVIR